MTEKREALTSRAGVRAGYPLKDGGRPSFLVCWIGWLPLAFLCGAAFGFVVGIAVGVFGS